MPLLLFIYWAVLLDAMFFGTVLPTTKREV